MIQIPRRAALSLGLLAAPALLLRPPGAKAQARWSPDRSMRLVVPFTPGGTTDILARLISGPLGAALGQTVVIENRGGAGGTVGAEVVARSAPDGLTIMMGHIGTLSVNPSLYPRLGYDPDTAFAPIGQVASVANILVVNPAKVAARNVQGLIAAAKRDPGGISYGSGGNGSAAHIAMAAFADATDTQFLHVPYRGTGPMMSDLISGSLDITMTGGPAVLPHVRDNRLVALGVSSTTRSVAAPDVPTIAEQGVPGFDATQWYGLVGPAGMPAPVVARLNMELNRILADAELQRRMGPEAAEVAPGTPEAFGTFIKAETARWGALIRKTGMKVE
ncbi:tripartite-type tricarboxylate transporter receptor subunit TctC [Humitalea rosea]|uniref:Tripartite-type tricarboxylate transporter receptor subunit TctC n=1 Tax=Humitalea rosea TaxID=990373 RepID=A0A2W7ISF8_9PROT|nr:tripartite tricarboxylate transporter substrate binding protein [Humitalea rosea]PZW48650.1 tripartite-type tricarboxylate transporter receptor subunit TctC [Humitalea rosea]